MRALALIAVATLCGAGTSAGAAPVTCDIAAYFLNSDAAGTNVRSAPSARAPILRTIDRDTEVVAAITGVQDGWFRIKSLETIGGNVDETIFDGLGWVHRSQLHLDVAGGHHDLRESPNRGARAVARVSGDQPDVELLGCAGGWAQIRASGESGWLARQGQCSNPLTTCP